MRGPLTRRRERRILEALTALGPLDDWDLYVLLCATQGTLNKALISLAAEGKISAKRNPRYYDPEAGHTWSVVKQGSKEAERG